MRRPQQSRTSQASVVDEDILAQADLEAMSSNPTPQSMEDEPSAFDRRRKRGPNRGLELIRRPERISIPLNGKHQPIGDDEPLLTRYIGLLARNCEVIPINYCDWRRVPVPVKERVWSLIKQRFLFPNLWVKKWVLGTYNASWKDWKYKLEKAFHDPYLPLDEQYEHRHSKVTLSVILTAAGVIIVALGDFSFDLFGYSMALTSVFFQTMYLVLVEKSGAEDGLSSVEIMFYNSFLSLPFLLFLIIATGEFPNSLSLLFVKILVETGHIGRQASGAVTVTDGETA